MISFSLSEINLQVTILKLKIFREGREMLSVHPGKLDSPSMWSILTEWDQVQTMVGHNT